MAIWSRFEALWRSPMAIPDPGNGPYTHPPDVSYFDPTLVHADPSFRSLQACLWLEVSFMALF